MVWAVSRGSHQFVQFLSAGSAGTFRSSSGLRWNMRGCRRGLTFSLLLVAMSAFGQQDQTPAPSAASPTSASADKAVRAPASRTDGSQTSEPARPLPDLTPDANGGLSQEQMRALTRVVAENYRANYKKQRDYTYIEREVQKKLDGKGQVKSTEVRTSEVMAIYGEQFERLIEKDDKPLSEKMRPRKKKESNEKSRSEKTNRKRNGRSGRPRKRSSGQRTASSSAMWRKRTTFGC
jgi:hypothetical protein